MAQLDINQIKKVNLEKNTVHAKVRCQYTVFELNGRKYMQIDSFGKDSRKNPDKVSQSIQLDYDDASKLVKIIREEFNL